MKYLDINDLEPRSLFSSLEEFSVLNLTAEQGSFLNSQIHAGSLILTIFSSGCSCYDDDFKFFPDGLPVEIVDLYFVEIVCKEHTLVRVFPAPNPSRSKVQLHRLCSQETLEHPGLAGLELILAL